MFNVALAKLVISQGSAMCASYVVGQVIANNVATPTLAHKGAVMAGRFAIGGLLADAVLKNTNERLDEIEQHVRSMNEKKESETPSS